MPKSGGKLSKQTWLLIVAIIVAVVAVAIVIVLVVQKIHLAAEQSYPKIQWLSEEEASNMTETEQADYYLAAGSALNLQCDTTECINETLSALYRAEEVSPSYDSAGMICFFEQQQNNSTQAEKYCTLAQQRSLTEGDSSQGG